MKNMYKKTNAKYMKNPYKRYEKDESLFCHKPKSFRILKGTLNTSSKLFIVNFMVRSLKDECEVGNFELLF